MKIRNKVIALTLLFGLAGALHAADGNTNVIYVTGTAKIEIAPDFCVIKASVMSDIGLRDKAVAALKVSSRQLVDTARSLGVQPSDIDGSEVSVGRQYRNEKEITAVKQKFSITARSLGACEQLIERLSAMPKLEALEASFQYSRQQKVESDLTIKAAEHARAKADMLASALGRKVGSVLAIAEEPFMIASQRYGDGSPSIPPPPAAVMMYADKHDDQLVRAPGTISFERTIYVRFDLQ